MSKEEKRLREILERKEKELLRLMKKWNKLSPTGANKAPKDNDN